MGMVRVNSVNIDADLERMHKAQILSHMSLTSWRWFYCLLLEPQNSHDR